MSTKGIWIWNVIPYPNFISVSSRTFCFTDGITFLNSDSSLNQTLLFFKDRFNELGIKTNHKSRNQIELGLVTSNEIQREAYELNVGQNRITIKASSARGIFYGLMTIWQQVKFSDRKSIPCGTIKDEPRFEYRGFMLDESRHFLGKEKVKRIIDIMAIFKLNTFHWHLTDEPGWRIEIKSFPKLSSIGGIGDYSNHDTPAKYYTHDDIQEVVRYAK